MASKDDERARRLADALRENLKRRKAQAREKGTQHSEKLRHPDENALDATSPGRGCAVRGIAHKRMDP
jgi:hypothetical protein